VRNRASALLNAGWLSPILAAAWVTLRSVAKASNTRRRFRSSDSNFIDCMNMLYFGNPFCECNAGVKMFS
jgi:hypothetical protein